MIIYFTKNLLLLLSITSVTGNTPNSVSHSCTTSFDVTLNIFLKQRPKTKKSKQKTSMFFMSLDSTLSQNSTWLVVSRLDTTRHVDVSSPCILAVSSLSSSTARHARNDELDTLNVSCRTWRYEPSGIWAIMLYIYRVAQKSKPLPIYQKLC